MRKWLGGICIFLGVACLLTSVFLVVNNRTESKSAANVAGAMLEEVKAIMDEQDVEYNADDPEKEVPSVIVDGYDCIGVLSIPVLELELPVLTDWDYAKLKKAPCRYYGSCDEKDFVIAAHNYKAHFGRLPELQQGDIVLFTDLSGTVHYYEVALLETLPPTATEQMITSGFDLSLYTCTVGGGSRVTVRCSLVQDSNQ